MTAVDRSVSDALFRHHLEGFKGYPRERDAKFLEVFNESVLSVDHARAVLDTFTVAMPVLQDIKDTAFNLRERFEVRESDRQRWEREYGPAQPFDVSAFTKEPTGRGIDCLWSEVLAFFKANNFDGKGDIQQVHWGRCWQVAKALGYEMNSVQESEIKTYEYINPKSRESLPKKKKQITEADFKALASGENAQDRWE